VAHTASASQIVVRLQRFALKPEPKKFLKALLRNAFKNFFGSFDRELL
jgi:hypothetical protein